MHLINFSLPFVNLVWILALCKARIYIKHLTERAVYFMLTIYEHQPHIKSPSFYPSPFYLFDVMIFSFYSVYLIKKIIVAIVTFISLHFNS